MIVPLLAVVTFGLRFHRAEGDERAAMWWPMLGLALLAALVVVGTGLAGDHEALVTVVFLVGAPVFPLAVAFGPVVRRLDSLAGELAELREAATRRPRFDAASGTLAGLTPRERTVLEAMAQGMSNPQIARTLHLSLSSVEKHGTSIFRKLGIADAPDTHRRVAAVVAYRDTLQVDEHLE